MSGSIYDLMKLGTMIFSRNPYTGLAAIDALQDAQKNKAAVRDSADIAAANGTDGGLDRRTGVTWDGPRQAPTGIMQLMQNTAPVAGPARDGSAEDQAAMKSQVMRDGSGDALFQPGQMSSADLKDRTQDFQADQAHGASEVFNRLMKSPMGEEAKSKSLLASLSPNYMNVEGVGLVQTNGPGGKPAVAIPSQQKPFAPEFETFSSPDGSQKKTVNKNGPDAQALISQGWFKYSDVKPPSRITYRNASGTEMEANGFPADMKGGQMDSDGQFHPPAASSGGLLNKEDLNFSAAQLLAGDTSVMQGLGVGAIGSRNRAALRSAYNQLATARGVSPEEAAAKSAEYFGVKAGERTLGTRSANIEMAVNEAGNMAKLARDASAKVPRGQWVPINKAMMAWNNNSGDPSTRAFGASVNSYLNAYATAVGKGTMTVDARNHAAEMLSTADGPLAFNAIMDQLDKEILAAKAAPGQVRTELRNSITGKEEGGGGGTVQKWVRGSDGTLVPSK